MAVTSGRLEYESVEWRDGMPPHIDADNMNRMEAGVKGSVDAVNNLGPRVRLLETSKVDEAKLADGAVTEPKLANGAVSASKIAAKAVTSAKIGDKAVGTSKIGDGAVTNPKIAEKAVSMANLDTDLQNLLTGSESGFEGDKPGGYVKWETFASYRDTHLTPDQLRYYLGYTDTEPAGWQTDWKTYEQEVADAAV